MKLYNSKLGLEVDFDENQVINLTVESSDVFADFVYNLYKQVGGDEGDFVLAEAEKTLSMAKNACIVTNPLIVNCEDRRIMNQLYKNLSDHVAKEHFEKFAEVNQHIIGFVDYVINTSEYNLVTDTDFVVANLLKYCNVHISTEYENFAEKFIDYLRAIKTICKLDVVFVINLKQYFNENYLFEIYKFCFYNKIFLVNVENIKSEAIEGDKYVIIDKDLCLLEL